MGARVPQLSLRALSPARKQGLFFKGLDYLNRTNAATMGFMAEGIAGGNALGAAWAGFTGKRTFGGQDVIAAATGIDPNSKWARRLGLVADVLNPFDPLNYIGFGGLTKAGKVGKAWRAVAEKGIREGKIVHRLPFKSEKAFQEAAAKIRAKAPDAVIVPEFAETIGQQARAGQRGLVTFRSPISGEAHALVRGARVLGGIGTIGGAAKKTKAAKELSRLFGGKRGEFLAGVEQDVGEKILAADQIALRAERLFLGEIEGPTNKVKALLNTKESVEVTDIIEKFYRDPQLKEQLYRDFIDAAPTVGKRDARRLALQEAERAGRIQAKHAKTLGPVGGLGEFGGIGHGFQSHQVVPRRGAPDDQVARMLGASNPLQPVIKFTGVENNKFNIGLMPQSTQPVTEKGLRASGQAVFRKLHRKGELGAVPEGTQGVVTGQEWYQSLTGAQKETFLKKHRLTLNEQADLLKDEAFVVRDQAAIIEGMSRQVGEAIHMDVLVDALEETGTATLWSNLDEAAQASGEWVKVTQGRWAARNLAVPKALDQAMEHFLKVSRPGPDKPWFGEMLNTILPEQFKDPGLLSWWRALAITGGGLNVPGFMARNFYTGLQHNDLEGLGTSSVRGIKQSILYYSEAAKTLNMKLKDFSLNIRAGEFPVRKFSKTGEGVTGDIVWKLGDGTEFRMRRDRFIGEFTARNFGGGGARDVENLNEIINASTKKRNQVFGGFYNANERLEFMLRAPLAMKHIEDSMEMARLAGRKIPARIDDIIPGDMADVAWVGAREAVIRAHFDYTDLTSFERKVRNNVLPFYTWQRNALPFHAVNMVQQFGKYTKFSRGYWNAFEQQGITPDNLPDWAAKSFAVPITPSEENMARWIDFTSFLPFMDLLQAGEALGTAAGALPFVTGFRPPIGGSASSELIRFAAVRGNPFITLPAELGLQRSFFTRRFFGVDTPEDVLGLTVGADKAQVAQALLPPIRKFEQLNPFNVLGRDRPGRNEPSGGFRALRSLTGVTVREAEKNVSDRSRKQVRLQLRRLKRSRRKALSDGDKSRVRFFESRIQEVEGQLGR